MNLPSMSMETVSDRRILEANKEVAIKRLAQAKTQVASSRGKPASIRVMAHMSLEAAEAVAAEWGVL